jgi:excisionase family DNA binding protein
MTMRTYESLPTAAARIGVSVKTIRRRIAEGALPVVRSGRSLHLDPKDVDALLRRYPQRTASEFASRAPRQARLAS